ncbi:VanZ family protein [Streptomyces sp. KAU_LT]|uniref:VanZ family protein n=1 Tax=Streptomyces sp. KAU_LT TaxID=3046669 RepID=UPI0024B6817E|nr:VanZ family protein [Streptomyces sp. KAU_LT]MDI9835254.1 VanZ family protein [Streptomyces sp. KAU_LT]
MIEASIEAVPGLLLSFGVLALMLALPVGLLARIRHKPVTVRVLCAVGVAGVCAATLLPADGGPVAQGAVCDVSSPFPQLFLSSSALLNVALFAPPSFFAVLVLRRPVTVAAVAVLSSGLIELIQAEGAMGRACSATDLVANATGALIGVAGGVVRSHSRGRGARRWKSDVLWGGGLAVLGALVVTGVFRTSVEPYVPLSERDGVQAHAHALEGSDAWIAEAVAEVCGAEVRVREVVSVERDGRYLVTASTELGDVVGWWPEKRLVQEPKVC